MTTKAQTKAEVPPNLIVAAPRSGVSSRLTPTILEGFVTAKGLLRLFSSTGQVPHALVALAKKHHRYLLTTANYEGKLVRLAVEQSGKAPAGLLQNVGCISDVAVSRYLVETALLKPNHNLLVLGTEERASNGERELTLAWDSMTTTGDQLLKLLLGSPTGADAPTDGVTVTVHAPSAYGPSSKLAVLQGHPRDVHNLLCKHFGLTGGASYFDYLPEARDIRVLAVTSRNNSCVLAIPNHAVLPEPEQWAQVYPNTVVFHSPDPLLQADVYTVFSLIGKAQPQENDSEPPAYLWVDLDDDRQGWYTHNELVQVMLNKIRPNVVVADHCREITGTEQVKKKPEQVKNKPEQVKKKPAVKPLRKEPLRPLPYPVLEQRAAAAAALIGTDGNTPVPAQAQTAPADNTVGVFSQADMEARIAEPADMEARIAELAVQVGSTLAVPEAKPADAVVVTEQEESDGATPVYHASENIPAALAAWAAQPEPEVETVVLTEQEAALYKLLKGNTRAMRRAVRAGKVARKAAVKKAFTTMLDTLAVDGQADIPHLAGLSMESTKLVLELMAEDAGVELFFLGSTVTV